MPEDRFEESLRYAFNSVLVKLYAVSLFGWVVMEFSQTGFMIIPHSLLRSLVSIPVYVSGLALVVGGIVGVLHRTLSDITRADS